MIGLPHIGTAAGTYLLKVGDSKSLPLRIGDESYGELSVGLLEFMRAAVGVQPAIVNGATHGGERRVARSVGIFVGRELDDVGDAVFALQFADGLARHVGRQRLQCR